MDAAHMRSPVLSREARKRAQPDLGQPMKSLDKLEDDRNLAESQWKYPCDMVSVFESV
jgi:hypothetical protein